jgi:hypothetical protein
MAYIAYGACALRRKRWLLAGGLLALATSIRAFPALSLLALVCPVLWWAYDYFRQHGKLPRPRTLFDEQRPFFMVAAGAAATGLFLFVFATALLGFSAWSDWLVKVGQLSAHPHGNHISLRSLVAGWGGDQSVVLRERLPLFLLGTIFFVVMVFAACRRQRFEQAAVLGMILTPVFFYPANYYIHLVWLLPLIMVERHRARGPAEAPFNEQHVWVGGLLLLLCAAQYFTVLEDDRGTHFYLASVLLFATLTAMLTVMVHFNVFRSASPRTAGASMGDEASTGSQGPDSGPVPATAKHDAKDGRSGESAAE